MIVFEHPESKSRVRFEVCGWIKFEAQQLLDVRPGFPSLIAAAEIEGERMTPINVDGAEVATGRDGVSTRGSVAMSELDRQASVDERACLKGLVRPSLVVEANESE